MKLQHKTLRTDVLIIGGGTAGCYAAYTLRNSGLSVLIVEKAGIERSGCLAAGVNAINAYINPGYTPQDYVDYARRDAEGIVRGDLLLTMAEGLNEATQTLEQFGLVFLKNPDGSYAARGARNVKINGENIKPLLAKAARQPNVTVLEHVNITDYLAQEGRVCGAVGFSVREPVAYTIEATAVLCATGGAAGLYRPNNPGFSRHKMWYPPFNVGSGYAMGLRAGAEMTTFEMRFVALRCKDTIAPTGTIAQGVGARQVNANGENYETTYGITTNQRVYGTTAENRAGHGPCTLHTAGIPPEQEQSLYKAYLNMAPAQTLKWLESGRGPAEQDVEIDGTEPYIVGGHTACGYWVDTHRAATLPGLFAAGDVAGGAPQKYVSGAMAEGKIAAESAAAFCRSHTPVHAAPADADYKTFFSNPAPLFTADELEEAMQKFMDEYAGGKSTAYEYSAARLAIAKQHIGQLKTLASRLHADSMDDLLRIYELLDRLDVCEAVIAHLAARHETRWPGFGIDRDHPAQSPAEESYVNSRRVNGNLEILRRPLVREGEVYEHSH